jgi:uncharacterized RDD family membrane protein YckC
MIAEIKLPPGLTFALSFQRLATLVIDLAPLLWLVALLMNIDPQAGLRELSGWALGSDPAAGKFPRVPTLVWWGASITIHTFYTLVFELLTRRTLGKIILGTGVLSEAGTPPTLGQVVTRNLVRFVELLPPLWVMGLLVVLSRNRQRLGDIFARTVVVRRVRAVLPPAPPSDEP